MTRLPRYTIPLLAVLLLLYGCANPGPWPGGWTHEETGRLQAGLALLDAAGLRHRADEVRVVAKAGRLLPLPPAWEYRTDPDTGLQDRLLAAYEPATDRIFVNRVALAAEPAVHVAEWLLNEAIHRAVPGDDTAAEHAIFHQEREILYRPKEPP